MRMRGGSTAFTCRTGMQSLNLLVTLMKSVETISLDRSGASRARIGLAFAFSCRRTNALLDAALPHRIWMSC